MNKNATVPSPLVDVSFLFNQYTEKQVSIRFHPKMYSIERDVEANWVWHAFEGMARLKGKLTSEGSTPRSFAAIGTGTGVDAIGAGLIFPELATIAVTDIEPGVLAQGLDNVRRNVSSATTVSGFVGDLCCPLYALPQRFDLIYANLPNLPVSRKRGGAIDFNTCYAERDAAEIDREVDAYLLGFQHLFLRSAMQVLNQKGSVLLMIGGRFPFKIFKRLADSTGYVFEELLCSLRLETDLTTTIDAYAAHEGDVEFDYYLYDEAKLALDGRQGLSGEELKELLAPHRVSAASARSAGQSGKRIGHTLHMLRAMPASAPGSLQ
jgi:hypothetical protein